MNNLNKKLENSFTETAHAYHRFLHSQFSHLDLHRGQPRLLAKLWEQDGLSQNEIAQQIHISNPTVSKMIKSLESNGYINRVKDDNDRRITRIFLSHKGRECQVILEKTFKEIETSLFRDFSPEELTVFEGLLSKIRTRVNEEMCDEAHI